MTTRNKLSRRQQILEALAKKLQEDTGARITTAALAKEVGVSEAALYRHFPSKSKMYEGLIEFIEESIFTRVSLILRDEELCNERCFKIVLLVLTFTDRNPGITRLLTGDALTGEHDRLRDRIVQFFDRLETQLKQVLREAELKEGLRPSIPVSSAANVILSAMEGRIAQYVRSGFTRSTTLHWDEQWSALSGGLFPASQPQN